MISAADAGKLTRAEIARQFCICEATLYEWLKRWRERGSVVPTAQRHGPEPTLGSAEREVLAELVEETNDAPLRSTPPPWLSRAASHSRACPPSGGRWARST